MSQLSGAVLTAPEGRKQHMDTRGLAAGVSLLLLAATAGCAAPPGAASEPEAPEEEVPLDLAVDSVDIVHGALRLSATMVDGAADVSVSLGGDCEHREVGGGWSTVSTLVWTFGAADVADAIGCGLAVRARVRTGSQNVTKVAELALTVGLVPCEEADDGPGVEEVAASSAGVTIRFARVAPRARLIAGDSSLEATPLDGEGADATQARFAVPRIDFARSLLLRWPLALDGASFDATVDIGGTALADDS
jgi:hypothetical protein